jgi:hypothetical protein
MKADKFGRPWLTGKEERPKDATCFKCGRTPYTVRNPFGVCLFHFSRAAESLNHPGAEAGFILCDECVQELWEFLHPMMPKDPRYIHMWDQYQARTRKAREDWNTVADQDHQIDPYWPEGGA